MDNFIVSARKYRPSNFRSVVGQATITTTLKNAIERKQLAQAYLFCGPRGVGKTTCARIFAKTINCQHLTSEFEACNECESCTSFNSNRSYNIHELDAASNNSVDGIRKLIEQVRIPPQIGKYSVYIIDEVHMLSTSAFNAFLKTLEEPPAHAIFIMATTEKHKILPTILSRCQIFDFNRIKVEDTVNYLKYIAEQEGVEYEESALNIIAQKADGAMRDALSIFDQVVSFSDNKISYAKTIENLNVLDYQYYFTLCEHFLNGEIAEALNIFDELLSKGFDAQQFITGLGLHFRNLLVSRDPRTVQLLEMGSGFAQQYQQVAQKWPPELLVSALNLTNQFDVNFRQSPNQRLHVELMLIRLCGLDQKKKDDGLNAGPEALNERETGAASTVQNYVKPSLTVPKPAPSSAITAAPRTVSLKNVVNNGHVTPHDATAAAHSNMPANSAADTQHTAQTVQKPLVDRDFTQEELEKAWKDFSKSIEQEQRSISTFLHNITPKKDGNKILVAVDNTVQDNLLQTVKHDLCSQLKQSLQNTALTLEVTISLPENCEAAQGKPNTYQEKLNFMLAQNPALKDLIRTLDLEFD